MAKRGTSAERRNRRDPVKLDEVRAKRQQAADMPSLVDADGNPLSSGIDYDRESRKHFKSVLVAAALNRGVHDLIAQGHLPDGYSGLYTASNEQAVYVANVVKGWVEGIVAFSHEAASRVANQILAESQARLLGQQQTAEEGADDDEEMVEDFDLEDDEGEDDE